MDKGTYKEGDQVKVFYQKSLTPTMAAEADKIYVKTFNEAMKSGYSLAAEVDKMLTERKLLDSDRMQASELEVKIAALENSLRKGISENKTPLTKQEAWQIALELHNLREQRHNIAYNLQQYYNMTAESYANIQKIQYMIYAVTCDEQGKPLWPSFTDYCKDNSELVAAATDKFLKLSRTTTNEARTYEEKWLNKFNCLKDGKLMNLDGVEVDWSGSPITTAPEVVEDDSWGVEKSTE